MVSKRTAVIGLLVVVAGLIVWYFTRPAPPVAAPAPVVIPTMKQQIIGKTVEGRNIEAYTYGTGTTTLLFVGGIHGGYEWNSVLLAYQLMDYLKANPLAVPKSLAVTVIPSLNPDAVFRVTNKEGRFAIGDVSKEQKVLEAARFNANKVDLNRNFDCQWQPKSTWRSAVVSAGSKVFSEPEAVALRDFVLANKPGAVVFWHSQSNTVYASACKNGILPQTLDIMTAYAKAADYAALKTFDAYAITGDAGDWLASIGIPALTVELKTHETIEWEQNLAGVKALFDYYARP